MSLSTESNNLEACSTGNCEYQGNLELLRQIPLFSGLPLEPVKIFAYLCTRENFKEGEFLFNQDEIDGQAFFILSGSVVIERKSEDGSLQKYAQYKEGAFVGGMGLLVDLRRLFSLKAESDCTVLVLTREKFSKVTEQFPDITPRILESLIESVRRWELKLLGVEQDECPRCRERVGVTMV